MNIHVYDNKMYFCITKCNVTTLTENINVFGFEFDSAFLKSKCNYNSASLLINK